MLEGVVPILLDEKKNIIGYDLKTFTYICIKSVSEVNLISLI